MKYEVSLSALSALRVDRSNATRRNVDQDSKQSTENCEKFLDRLRIKIIMGGTASNRANLDGWWMSSALWCRSKYQDRWENDRERCIEN